MKKDVIHVKLEFEDALNSKKNLLQTEMSLLNILKTIGAYRILRKKELSARLKLRGKFRETASDLRKLQKYLPEANKKEEVLEKIPAKKQKIKYDRKLEDELKDIQMKLRQLEK